MMKRTTIFADINLINEVKEISKEENRSVAEIIREAIRELAIEHIDINDLRRCIEILKRYQNLNIDFVDASIIAISERLKVFKLLTTDRRHFSVIKPRHGEAFILLP